MRKLLTFIPLGIGISAAIIYVFNIIQFRVINNSATLFQILSNLKIYLYISIAGFIFYFLIKVLTMLGNKNKDIEVVDNEDFADYDTYEPFEEIKFDNRDTEVINDESNVYVPNYSYVPVYQEKPTNINIEEKVSLEPVSMENQTIAETKDEIKQIVNRNKYCYNCGEEIYEIDRYCSSCGAAQQRNKKHINPFLKNVINVLEIVILLLIIYFSLNMLFDYKESKDPNFTSPFKVSMTK